MMVQLALFTLLMFPNQGTAPEEAAQGGRGTCSATAPPAIPVEVAIRYKRASTLNEGPALDASVRRGVARLQQTLRKKGLQVHLETLEGAGSRAELFLNGVALATWLKQEAPPAVVPSISAAADWEEALYRAGLRAAAQAIQLQSSEIPGSCASTARGGEAKAKSCCGITCGGGAGGQGGTCGGLPGKNEH